MTSGHSSRLHRPHGNLQSIHAAWRLVSMTYIIFSFISPSITQRRRFAERPNAARNQCFHTWKSNFELTSTKHNSNLWKCRLNPDLNDIFTGSTCFYRFETNRSLLPSFELLLFSHLFLHRSPKGAVLPGIQTQPIASVSTWWNQISNPQMFLSIFNALIFPVFPNFKRIDSII